MKILKLATTSGLLGLTALAAITSLPAVADDSGWYNGFNIGQSRERADQERISSQILGPGFTSTVTSRNSRDVAYKLLGGYKFNQNFALEAGYFNLGRFDFTSATVPAGTLDVTTRVKGLALDTVGIMPFTERFSGFGRIGITFAETHTAFGSTGAVPTPPTNRAHNLNPKFGLGVQYDFSPHWSSRAEIERYRIDDAASNKSSIDYASLGIVYRFAANTYQQPMAMAREQQPSQSPRSNVSFSTDSLSDFDSAAVRPEGKQALDEFSAKVRESDFDVITVTGHTDRIGPHDYNLDLSARRAEAVKSYLVESTGIPAHKIEARGVNGSYPVTKPGECVGNEKTPALIACLQPDRHADVKVTGTR